MNIDSIVNGIVIDHITAGLGKEIYNLLHLSNLDCMVALITNASSVKMGRKDIIKIASAIELDTDALGYVDPGVPVSIIADDLRLAADAGVKLTEAGATFPYHNDPNDSNIRIAPSFPPCSELREAMYLLCICIKLTAVRKLLMK